MRKKSSHERQFSISFRTFVSIYSLPVVVMILVYLPWAMQQRISSRRRNSVPLGVLIAILADSMLFQFDFRQTDVCNQKQFKRICIGNNGLSEQVEIPGYGYQ